MNNEGNGQVSTSFQFLSIPVPTNHTHRIINSENSGGPFMSSLQACRTPPDHEHHCKRKRYSDDSDAQSFRAQESVSSRWLNNLCKTAVIK